MTRLSVYWGPAHKADRPRDLDYLREVRPYDVLILQPDVQDVIDAHAMAPEAEVALRWWELDDGRTKQDPQGVYAFLRSDPHLCGVSHAEEMAARVQAMEAEANRRGARIPEREQLLVHLINEPDSNDLMAQINEYTVAACEGLRKHGLRAEALNLGTGHPALLNASGEPDWSPLAGALDAIVRGDHYAVVHEYYNDLGLDDPDVNPWHVFRHKWAPRGPRWKIGEFGLEMLVNGRRDGHQGWIDIREPAAYVAEVERYARGVRDDVAAVRLYMTDYRDKIWATFDTAPIAGELVALQRRLEEETHTVHIPTVMQPKQPQGGALDPAVMMAILDVESGAAFGDGGRLIIRFEAHIFKAELGDDALFGRHFRIADNRPWEQPQYWRAVPGEPWTVIHSGQAGEWAAFRFAESMDRRAALRSISMGRPQIMGFNHERVGYGSVEQMFAAFADRQSGEAAQIVAFINYMLTDAGLMAAVRARDWREIAAKYNGSGGVDVYAPRLEAAWRARGAPGAAAG